MDADTTSIHDIHTGPADAMLASVTSSDDDSAAASAQLEWDMSDAAALAPNHVHIAKVQRAWERQPASPFARRRFKVGKIMKRTGSASAHAPTDMFNVLIREPLRPHATEGTPLKAVKKMRVEGTSGRTSSIVSNWDGRGSPQNRRIVTRSARGDEQLVALADEDEDLPTDDMDVTALVADNALEGETQNDPEGTTVEILDESGTKMLASYDVDADEWIDESDDATDSEDIEQAPDQSEASLQQDRNTPPTTGCEESSAECDVDDYATEVDDEEESAKGWQKLRDELPEERRKEAKSLGIPLDEYLRRFSPSSQSSCLPKSKEGDTTDLGERAGSIDATDSLSRALSEAQTALPPGFVSPAVARRRPISQVKAQNASRRRTLPKDFAARQAAIQDDAQVNSKYAIPDEQHDSPQEDACVLTPEQAYIKQQRQTTFGQEDSMESTESLPTPTSSPSSRVPDDSATARFSSPVPSIAGSHPRLPLRRSPRRQSSSPFMRKSILKSTQKPHLIAFTPIKRSEQAALHGDSSPLPFVPSGIPIGDDNLERAARSSSAPPEEPQMSPRRHQQPRISDDTALLEAFLKRASESKSSKRVSETARRESFERQAEGSVVPQALASSPPVQVAPKSKDVLGDLDPNSPSPRKASTTLQDVVHDQQMKAEDAISDDHDDDELAAQTNQRRRPTASRKSGRTKKKPETLSASTYSGPAKISIKGRSEGIVLKQTEAHRLAMETRKNTQGNKKGAAMPLVRLKTLREEAEALAKRSPELGSDMMEIEKPTGRKGITWSETLVSFYQGDEPENSMMTEDASLDPLSSQDDTVTGLEAGAVAGAVAEAPPASATPSKPRMRRLKPSRTASTPVKAKPVAGQSAMVMEGGTQTATVTDKKPKSSTSVKRQVSRIATPAKPKRSASSSVDDDDTVVVGDDTLQSIVPPDASSTVQDYPGAKLKRSIPTPASKRTTGTRLPAPTATLPQSGKENNLIASPHKKRMTKTSTHAAAAPMKLGQSGEPRSLAAAPKFDIQKVSKCRAGIDGSEASLIFSPPKKSARVLPGKEVARGIVLGVGVGVEDQDIKHGEMSLKSPAKKRTSRRMIS
ncbi:hypothetical protein CKM354_000805500 [Cercospora kikuchii]|uniref:Uncharacterized protein n=1 Tax=Cercospora kikuchii TaxID=84275 RepID=A0A9P3CL85_9PEZI|nr:uncharacterized protein CKM354_000805500 [Cercospora kikuchii]GIZ44869.1 hypothetical protein CKM354_000805500 [Cercospora kikuchii]